MADDILKLATRTQLVYQRNAALFAQARVKDQGEMIWLDQFLELIPSRGLILDLGCGPAGPIAKHCIQNEYRLIGLDASENMIALARKRFPTGDWRIGDMRALNLPERFDGIVGWHSFFHLTQDEQRQTLPLIARHLRPGGALMLTVGHTEGNVAGRVGEDAVFHASLSIAEYTAIFAGLNISIRRWVPKDPECRDSSVLLVQKAGQANGYVA